MPLFQQSVQKKFIAELDKVKVENAYQKLIAHFSNPDIQANIRNAKEEEYQEGFVRDLFVNVFDYVLNPQPNFNFVLEKKNEKDSKKADGAIIRYNEINPVAQQVCAVIELKSIKTVDLQSIEIQAFGYKNNQSDCVYIITSNFQKIRFYIENAIEFEEFDLFDISKERFALLYLCLHADNILSDLPLRVKKLSLEKEESITNKLYADYSLFKQVLFKDVAAQNKDIDRFVLFKKTQKLLDRFLFIFFAEDKGLLPPNSVAEILTQWDKLKELDEYQPLYSRFKKYFGYLNSGYKGKNYDIFAYNGGLFAPDELLDGLKITDNLLYIHCQVLAHYDFNTDVDTNILGHIFEHSLNEMDEMAASVEGEKLDKNKTKRKKDGVFYTPRYITKYIVESTIGELCKKEKTALGLDNETLIKIDTKKDKKIYQEKINEYRQWLLQLTILDPACGSGAFLNQALEFLIEEHRQVDSMTAMLFGDAMLFTDNVTEILENNIFGVDINEESVEIARLSLWLRTAKVGRKLNDLSRNIKCGNSLISDAAVAGDLAFDWKAAFPQVFEKGGFDVVIGNPPYVVYIKSIFGESVINHVMKEYNYAEYNPNTYALFTELGLKILKSNGFLGFIIPNSWMQNKYFSKMRKGVYSTKVNEIVYLKNTAFQEVVETVVLLLENQIFETENIKLTTDVVENQFVIQKFEKEEYINGFNPFVQTTNSIILKLDALNNLKNKAIVYRGLETKDNEKWLSTSKKDENYRPILLGKDVNRYSTEFSGTFVNFIKKEMKSNANEDFYNKGKILMRRTGSTIIVDIDLSKFMALKNLYLIIPKNENDIYCIAAQLNSTLFDYYHKSKTSGENKAFAQFTGEYIEKFPCLIDKTDEFKLLIEEIYTNKKDFQKHTTRFLKLFDNPRGLNPLNVNKKLETWYDLTFGEFRKELEKQKIVIAIKELMDYQELFDTNKDTIQALKTKINQTEKEIDKLVYQLYELTPEEIQIIENN